MAPLEPTTAQRLLSFNQLMLDQALMVVGAHAVPGAPCFAGPVGAHLRHVIEHYQALVDGAHTGVVDYDGRPRERQLETSPARACDRLTLLRLSLGRWSAHRLDQPLQVLGQGGIVGDFQFTVASSLGRELAFLASHTVHHFALLVPHLHRQGIGLPTHFGKAPGTVANEITQNRASTPQPKQEIA